jgi:hypothetical protein
MSGRESLECWLSGGIRLGGFITRIRLFTMDVLLRIGILVLNTVPTNFKLLKSQTLRRRLLATL